MPVLLPPGTCSGASSVMSDKMDDPGQCHGDVDDEERFDDRKHGLRPSSLVKKGEQFNDLLRSCPSLTSGAGYRETEEQFSLCALIRCSGVRPLSCADRQCVEQLCLAQWAGSLLRLQMDGQFSVIAEDRVRAVYETSNPHACSGKGTRLLVAVNHLVGKEIRITRSPHGPLTMPQIG